MPVSSFPPSPSHTSLIRTHTHPLSLLGLSKHTINGILQQYSRSILTDPLTGPSTALSTPDTLSADMATPSVLTPVKPRRDGIFSTRLAGGRAPLTPSRKTPRTHVVPE